MKTALILLAAGASRRMGSPKQLLPIQGEAALVFCLKRILAAALSEVVVVLGHHSQSILPLLEGLPVVTVLNPEPESQMADSVRMGLGALSPGTTGIMIALADHPLVLPTTYQLLLQQHALREEKILIPTYRQRGGHPTLFPAALLKSGEKPRPLHQLIAAHHHKVERLPLADPGIVRDMDYPGDYRRLLALAAAEENSGAHGPTAPAEELLPTCVSHSSP